MAVIFSTGFEDYANGEQSLLDHGWVGPIVPGMGERCHVVSDVSHGGAKSCMCGNDLHIDPFPATIDLDQQIYRTIAPSGANASGEAWFRKPVGAISGSQSPPGCAAHVYLFYNDIPEVSGAQFVIPGGLGRHNDVQLLLNSTVLGTVYNAVPDHTLEQWFALKVQIHMSTVNGTLDGVNHDGCVSCSVNGQLVIALTDIAVWVTSAGWASGLNHAPNRFQCGGAVWLDDVEVTDDAMICGGDPGDPDVPPPNTSDPCCGSEPPTPGGPNAGDPPVYPPLQPWDRECAGGGTVPAWADVTDAESWTL